MDSKNKSPEPEKKASAEEKSRKVKGTEQKKEAHKTDNKGSAKTEINKAPSKVSSESKSFRNIMADKTIIAKILEKFPIFNGLTPFQYQQILNICAIKSFVKENIVCDESDVSNEMFILISGKLDVMFRKKTVLTTITPISLVGELVFFTGEQGYSSVVAKTNCTVISIRRDEFFQLLKRDCTLSYNILMNVIKELTQKLRSNDALIDELKKK